MDAEQIKRTRINLIRSRQINDQRSAEIKHFFKTLVDQEADPVINKVVTKIREQGNDYLISTNLLEKTIEQSILMAGALTIQNVFIECLEEVLEDTE